MKKVFFFAMLLITGLLIIFPYFRRKEHSFGIFLVKNGSLMEVGTSPYYLKPLTIDIKSAELEEKPIISDEDLISFDWPNQTSMLKKESLKVLPNPDNFGRPFILKIDEQRIYVGGFISIMSSVGCDSPVIEMEDLYRKKIIIKRNSMHFKIKGEKNDPRYDQRIYNCLKALGKIIE